MKHYQISRWKGGGGGCERRYVCPESGCEYSCLSFHLSQARVDQDGETASIHEEDGPSSSETASSKSSSSAATTSGRAMKPKKPEKNKMPPVTKKGLKGESRGGADPGYISGGSQGGQHSPLKGYGSPPAPHDMEHGPGQWKQEDELTTILRHQTLSDPNDPTSPMTMTFSPHGAGGGYRAPPEGTIPMEQGPAHLTSAAHPNGKASQQQRGGGLAVLAGRTPGNPQAPQQPAKTFHHHPSQGPHPHPHPPHPHQSHQQPPPSYHQPLLYSPSRQASHYQTHFITPSFPSYHSGYSSLPAESRQPQPPSSVPYTQQLQLPPQAHHHHLRENESTRPTSHMGAPPGGGLPTPASSGYSSCGSPKGVHHQKSPSDDSSVVGGASIHSNPMTNSYSTFSSNSSRVSTPSNGNPQFLASKANPRGPGDPGKGYPLQQSFRMPGRAASTDEAMSETSGRSWVYSSQSSRYSAFSTGSELSDDVLERLPTDRLRRHSFTKAPPLPLPESMQEQMNGTMHMTGMECSPPHGNGTGVLLGDTYPHPQSPVSMQLDFHGDKTMRLYHLPPESAALFTPNDAHLPYYSNSQCVTDTFDFQMTYNDGSHMPNAVFGDMGSSFPNTLQNDPQQYFDSFLNSQAN